MILNALQSQPPVLFQDSVSLCRNLVQVDSSVLAVVVHATVLVDGCRADSVGKTSLASEVETLLGSSGTTNESILTIEVLGHLLERGISGLSSVSVLYMREEAGVFTSMYSI